MIHYRHPVDRPADLSRIFMFFIFWLGSDDLAAFFISADVFSAMDITAEIIFTAYHTGTAVMFSVGSADLLFLRAEF